MTSTMRMARMNSDTTTHNRALLLLIIFCIQVEAVSGDIITEQALLTSTSETIPWVFQTPITSPLPISRPRKVTDPEQVLEYLNKCPSLVNRLENEFCPHKYNSCKNRCTTSSLNEEYTCKCDVYCKVFDDCCWDFEQHCPSVLETFYREHYQLINAKTTCHDDWTLVNNCGDRTTENVTHQQQPDPRAPILDVNNELTFRNWTVYHQCYTQELPHQHKLTYWDHFIVLKKGASIETLQNLFRGSGNLDGLRFTFITSNNERYCSYVIKMSCRYNPKDDMCKFKGMINIAHSSVLCAMIQQANNGRNVIPGNEAAGVNGEPYKRSQSSNMPNYCRIRNDDYFIHAKRTFDLSLMHVAIRVNFGDHFNQPLFSKELGSYSKLNPHVKTYACESSDASVPCRIVAMCEQDFIPVDLICRKPKFLMVEVVGKINKPFLLDELLTNIFLFSGNIDFISFDKNVFDRLMEVTYNSEFKLLSNFWEIKKVDGLSYSDSKLSITDTLIQKLRKNSDGDLSFVRRITICVVLAAEEFHAREVLCDLRLFQAGFVTYIENYRLTGKQTMNPFTKPYNESTSKATDSAGRIKPSTLNTMLFPFLVSYAIVIPFCLVCKLL